jgi:hypothetical protein
MLCVNQGDPAARARHRGMNCFDVKLFLCFISLYV